MRRHRVRWVLWVALCGTFTASAASTQDHLTFDDFHWELIGEGNGFASLNHVEMFFISSDVGSPCDFPTIRYRARSQVAGIVTASFEWSTTDVSSPGGFGPYDWLGYDLDGTQHIIASGSMAEASGGVLFAVPADTSFGFSMTSLDCIEGPGVGAITNFRFTPGEFPGLQFWTDQGGEYSARDVLTVVGSEADGTVGQAVELLGELVVQSNTRGELRAYAALACSPTWTLQGAEPDFAHALAALGDIDGDGVPEVAASAPSAASVTLLSGASGAVLWSWSSGSASLTGYDLAALADQNGDGVEELIVGERALPPATPIVRVLSGSDGALLQSLAGPAGWPNFGEVVADAGDVDGDGWHDVVVGAPDEAGRAFVYARHTDDPILDFGSGIPGWDLSLDSAGDLNGDGLSEILIGAPKRRRALNPQQPNMYSPEVGSIRVIDAATGTMLNTLWGVAAYEHFGAHVGGRSDFDEDGQPDLVTTRVLFEPQRTLLVALDPLSGEVVGKHPADSSVEARDFAIRRAPELQLALTFPDLDPFGAVRVWSHFEFPLAPLLEASGLPVPGGDWSVDVTRGVPQGQGYLVVGTQRVDLEFKGGVLQPAPTVVIPFTFGLDAAANVSGDWPVLLDLGVPLWFQVWSVASKDGAPVWAASRGLQSIETDA